MSRRSRSVLEEEVVSEPGPEIEETRRTRSGRRVRTPAALLGSEVPVRTPSRRTRRSVIQERKEDEEEQNVETQEKPGPIEEQPAESATAEVAGKGDDSPPATVAATPLESVPAAPVETPPVEPLPETQPKKKARVETVKPAPVVPLGKPKSGRVWKDRNKKRFSSLLRDKPLCSSWEKKMQAKREKELVKQYSMQLKAEKDRQKEELRKRREFHLKRRAENERKAEIVQVIKNTSKIKRMKKKQLRKIEKRDTLAILQKSNSQNPTANKQSKSKKKKAPTERVPESA
ncbi:coiled-coil domain-containing protein 86 [Synchiropus splendidus]|uniref:coiled-coil domain-containing protein 86 n=1 Tax=Synchiropus splendidus TaxID=270530 RepID=UPI00237D96C2|nr:coiled-coil domain-containing protein 86 [Synchiropus splendidus]